MELLKKISEFNEEKRELLDKERHPQKAEYYRDRWFFIKDQTVKDNIAYQSQYLEFMIHLYNDYQIWWVIESLLFKNIIFTIAVISEAVLYDICGTKDDGEEKLKLSVLIDRAYINDFINDNLKEALYSLKHLRNQIHISNSKVSEYDAYTLNQTNVYIGLLDNLNKHLSVVFSE